MSLKRLRVVPFYEINNLHFQRGRFSILKTMSVDENINCSEFSNLRASSRTVQKCLNLLGWRKIRVKYCQYVS